MSFNPLDEESPIEPKAHANSLKGSQNELAVYNALAGVVLTNEQIQAITGLSRGCVLRYLGRLMDAKPKKVFVCGFVMPLHAGRHKLVYAQGNKPDVAGTRLEVEQEAAVPVRRPRVIPQQTWASALGL